LRLHHTLSLPPNLRVEPISPFSRSLSISLGPPHSVVSRDYALDAQFGAATDSTHSISTPQRHYNNDARERVSPSRLLPSPALQKRVSNLNSDEQRAIYPPGPIRFPVFEGRAQTDHLMKARSSATPEDRDDVIARHATTAYAFMFGDWLGNHLESSSLAKIDATLTFDSPLVCF
jgi:hypothetical protein